METQAVALVNPEYMTDITARISHFKMKENFTFVPKYHVADLYDETGHDLKEFAKQLYESNWGIWSPRQSNQSFIQSVTLKDIKDVIVRVILVRDFNEHKTIFVYRETRIRYMNTMIDASLCCYMCDLDDDGEFYSEVISNNALKDIDFLNN